MLIEYFLVIVFLSPGPIIKSYVRATPFETVELCADYAQNQLLTEIDSFNPPAKSIINIDCIRMDQETI